MALIQAKIENIHPNVLITNRKSNLPLKNNSPIEHNSIISVLSNKPLYDTIVYKVAILVGQNNYEPVISVYLDVTSGFGSKRTDRFIIDDDDNLRIIETYNIGILRDKFLLQNQIRREERDGIFFKFANKYYRGILSRYNDNQILELGGTELNSDQQLVCSRQQFGNISPIKSKSVLDLVDDTYQVGEIITLPSTIIFNLQRVQ